MELNILPLVAFQEGTDGETEEGDFLDLCPITSCLINIQPIIQNLCCFVSKTA